MRFGNVKALENRIENVQEHLVVVFFKSHSVEMIDGCKKNLLIVLDIAQVGDNVFGRYQHKLVFGHRIGIKGAPIFLKIRKKFVKNEAS